MNRTTKAAAITLNNQLKESMERLARYDSCGILTSLESDIQTVLTAITELQNALLPFTKLVERANYSFGVITQGDIKGACALLDVKPACHICDDTGWNHGVQCTKSVIAHDQKERANETPTPKHYVSTPDHHHCINGAVYLPFTGFNKELKESIERLRKDVVDTEAMHFATTETADDVANVLTAIKDMEAAIKQALIEFEPTEIVELIRKDEREKVAELDVKPTCHICDDTGWNHGVQCKPNKAHPTGWKTEKCSCRTPPEGEG